MLALVGVINVPIIYFSVKWWNTLHQGSSVSLTAAPKMAMIMLTGMLIMAFAAWFYAIAVTLVPCARDHARARARRGLGRRTAGGSIEMSEFFAMGGYGFYVWGSFGRTALVVVAELRLGARAAPPALEEARSGRHPTTSPRRAQGVL